MNHLPMGRIAAVAAITLGLAVPASAESFKMQTFLGASAATTVAFEEMAAKLAETSGGAIEIEVLPANAVVGRTETIDAIENGILHGQYTAPSYFAGKDPALAVLGDTLAAYPDSKTRDTWMSEGGGLEIARDLYAKYGLYLVGFVYWPPEHIPSTVAINTVADFEGVKIRSPEGLVGDLLTRAGASIVNVGPAETVNALETGVIDAADFASPSINVAFGIHNAAKFSIFARHSMPTTEVSVSMDKWNSLSAEHQQMFIDAVAEMSESLNATLDEADAAAIQQAANELEVTAITFGPEDEAKFRAMADEIWTEWAKKSDETATIIESYRAHLDSLGLR